MEVTSKIVYAVVQLNDRTPGILVSESNTWTTEMWTEPSAEFGGSGNNIYSGECILGSCHYSSSLGYLKVTFVTMVSFFVPKGY